MSAIPFATHVVDHRPGIARDHYVGRIAVPITVREFPALPGRNGRGSFFDGENFGDMRYDGDNMRVTDRTGSSKHSGVAAWQDRWDHWPDSGTPDF